MGDRTRDATRMEKLLEDASIKVPVVASNITGVSSRVMLAALVGGQRDPVVLAQLAKGKMRAKIPDLTEALTGHFDDHHEVLVGQMLGRLRHIHDGLVALDELIGIEMAPWAHQLDLLVTIPGVGPKTFQVFIAETGGDMGRFPTAEQLAAWVGVAPAMNESAGHRSGDVPALAAHGEHVATVETTEHLLAAIAAVIHDFDVDDPGLLPTDMLAAASAATWLGLAHYAISGRLP